MVNINVAIPDELHKELKLSSIRNDKTLKEYIIEQLERGLRRREP